MAIQRKHRKKRSRAPLIFGAVVVALGGGLWLLSQNMAGVNMPSTPVPNVNLLPPPPPAPPPPPPTKEPPPPPDRIETPKPNQPKDDNQPKQMTIAGPAQAGGDAFGLGAGKGGGSTVIGGTGEGAPSGGDFANANYMRVLKNEIQQAMQSDSRIERQFSTAMVGIWVSSDGRVRRSKIHRTTGDDRVDAELISALRAMPPLRDRPPAGFPFPQDIEIKGVRRG